MARKTKSEGEGVNTMPMSVTELEPLVQEFMDKLRVIKHEQETLKEQESELMEEWSSKLDMKVLKAAMKIIAARHKIERQEALGVLEEVLDRVGV